MDVKGKRASRTHCTPLHLHHLSRRTHQRLFRGREAVWCMLANLLSGSGPVLHDHEGGRAGGGMGHPLARENFCAAILCTIQSAPAQTATAAVNGES